MGVAAGDVASKQAGDVVSKHRPQSQWSFSRSRHGCSGAPAPRLGASLADRLACHFNAAFWTRAAFVLLLALSVLATALFVLRLYNAKVYHEAEELGRELQQKLITIIELQMGEFVGDMVRGTIVLSGTLQGQGLVPLLKADARNDKAVRLAWDAFNSAPSANVVAFGVDGGTTAYLRTGDGQPPVLIQSEPDKPGLPSGPWTARSTPVDPLWGVPLANASVTESPTVPFTQQSCYARVLQQAPGTVFWVISPKLGDNGGYTMFYSAYSALWLGTGTAAIEEPSMDAMQQGSDDLVPGPGYQVVGMARVGQDTASLMALVRKMDLRGGRLFCVLVDSGDLVLASHGDVLRYKKGGEGAPGVPSMMKAEESRDDVIAAAGWHLRQYNEEVAAACKKSSSAVDGVVARNGSLADEEAVSRLADFEQGHMGQMADYVAEAAKAGLCWNDYEALIHVNGKPWYLHCRGHLHGGPSASLPLVTVLLVPRARIMGDVDASRHRTLVLVTTVVAVVAAVGIMTLSLSTVGADRLAEDKEGLEEEAELQEGEMRSMARELEAMRAMFPGGEEGEGQMVLDMRTPMQVVHDLIAELLEESSTPGPKTLMRIKSLLMMPELHMPILLQQQQQHGLRSQSSGALDALLSPLPGQMGIGGDQAIDADTRAWLQSVVMRVPKRQSISRSPVLARASSLRRSCSVERNDLSPLASPSNHRGSDGSRSGLDGGGTWGSGSNPLRLSAFESARERRNSLGAISPVSSGTFRPRANSITLMHVAELGTPCDPHHHQYHHHGMDELSLDNVFSILQQITGEPMSHFHPDLVHPDLIRADVNQTTSICPPSTPIHPPSIQRDGDQRPPRVHPAPIHSNQSSSPSNQQPDVKEPSGSEGPTLGSLSTERQGEGRPKDMLLSVVTSARPCEETVQSLASSRHGEAIIEVRANIYERFEQAFQASRAARVGERGNDEDGSKGGSSRGWSQEGSKKGAGGASPRMAGASKMTEIQAALEAVGSWNYDSWRLSEACGGRPILWMGLELFWRMGLVKEFRLPVAKLLRFLARLDDGMQANCYHNSTHIVDVANSLYHLLSHSGLAGYLTRLDVLAATLAALVHDFRHPGLNNDYVVKSCDELALRYNDRTVLENYHVAEAFLLLADESFNFLQGLPKGDFNYVRNVIIEMVLGSDLKRHFELLDQFTKRVKDKDKPLDAARETDRLLLLQIALKVADIGHAAKKLAIHKVWTDAITEEFFRQGDREREAGFKVSPFMDREQDDLAKSQLGFFSFIALPLFDAWVLAFPASSSILDEVFANVKYWEERRDGAPAVF